MVQKLKKRSSKKLIVGITGSFGSGKSTVSDYFAGLGAGRIDADEIVHDALSRKGPIYDQIAKLFRNEINGKRKSLDRKKIAEIIFHDSAKRKKLESILHPYVFETVLDEAPEMKEPIIVLDIPLLFETGFHRYCHKTVVVQSPSAVIRSRLRKKGFTLRDIAARVKAQMPIKQKIKRADYVIQNGASLQKTNEQINKVWKKLCSHLKGDQ